MLEGWGFKFVQIKGLALLDLIRSKIRKILINIKKSYSLESLARMH